MEKFRPLQPHTPHTHRRLGVGTGHFCPHATPHTPATAGHNHGGAGRVPLEVCFRSRGGGDGQDSDVQRERAAAAGGVEWLTRRLLDALDADIICFQETKLSRQHMSGNVIMAEGYEAFISCNRTWKGHGAYSGVTTFCRVTSAFSSQEVALPVAAEGGFTGVQDSAKDNEIIGDFVLEMPVGEEGLGEITREELLRVDNDGRCIITDHGHFVLFNIYGPAVEEDGKDRIRFQLLFYKILQKLWEYLLALGKRVFVVGDLNIAPASVDRCDAPTWI